MGGSSSTDYLKTTFLNKFFVEKDWKECDKLFQCIECTNGQILDNRNCQILYLLSGEISLYYVNRDENNPNPANFVKNLQSGTLYCFHDIEDDLFESGKSLKMILQCTTSSSDPEPTKYLTISKEKLMDYLNASHLQALKSFFQTSPSTYLQNNNPLFRDLNLDQIHMIESCIKYVPIDSDSAISLKGMSSSIEGGYMGILLQGKAVQKSDTTALNRVNSGNNSSKGKGDNEAPPPLLSSNSIHSMTSTERNSTKSPSRKMAPLSARGRQPKINPMSTLQPGDKLLPLGSVIGAEVCLRRNMPSLTTVVAQTDCIIGMISYQDLERIDSILPMTLRTLENNLKCLLLENLIHTIPILHDITPTDLFSLSKRCTLVSYDKDTLLFSQGEEGRRFYMILKGETQISISPSSTTSTSAQFTLTTGAYFGEVALILRKPLTASATVLAGSMLFYMEKSDYLSSFSRNHQSIAEVSIRLQGIDTPLLHIMRHSKGYHHFLQFLRSELAPEGAIFWHRIDKIEDTCAFWNSLQNPNQQRNIALNPKRYDPNMSASRVKVPYPSSLSLSILGTHEDGMGSAHPSRQPSTIIDTSHLHVDHMKHLLHLTDEIMEQHIHDGAQYQVNLPATMIKKIIAGYTEIRSRMTDELQKDSIALSFYNEVLQTVPALFSQAKHEVFMLLKDDNYARWNKMESFQQFINEMKPYVF